jgi:hypothetical protein
MALGSVILLTMILNIVVWGQSNDQTIQVVLEKQSQQFTSEPELSSYHLTVYNPPFRFLLPKEVSETSGLAYFNGKLWTINDSGGKPIVYGLDPLSGKIVQRITVRNASNNDWESLAQDNDFLYIGDFGNNSGNRNDLKIYKIAWKNFPETGDLVVDNERITFQYNDYKGPVEKRKDNNFDCEAFFAAGDSLYLFSKNWENQQCRLYALPKTPGDFKTHKLASFGTRGMITGADINPITGEVILTGYVNKTWVPFLWYLSDYHDHQFFSGKTRRIDLVNLSATQIESIVFTDSVNGVITSEGHILFSQTAFDISTDNWNKTPDKSTSIPKPLTVELSPNPAKGKNIFLDFDSSTNQEISIQLFDEKGNQIQLIEEPEIKIKDYHHRIKIKISHLKPGKYLVRIKSGTQQVDEQLTIES